MNGSALYTFVSSLIDGFNMDSTLFYTLLNVARTNREGMRPFMRLRNHQYSQTVSPMLSSPTDLFQNPFTLPSDFNYLSEDGEITLFSAAANTWQTYKEIDIRLAPAYLQQSNMFYIDHMTETIYLLGIVDQLYKMLIPYQADLGDITASTVWTNIPKRYHPILGFDLAAMYRLGVDYDDINARNADNNALQANLLFDGMCKWDDNLQRSALPPDRPTIGEAPTFVNRKINI